MLVIKNLTKIYKGTTKGITDISLHVQPGDIYAFIGHNGAGKTTLLRAVTGIHTYDEGSVTIDGLDLAKEPVAVKQRIAYVPDIADIYGVSTVDRESRIAEYAKAFEIMDALGDLVSGYSHGMKQKLVLISTLIHEPKLLIMDEPFVGLDPKAAFLLKEYMRKMTEHGCAIFFSTHVLDVAEKLCNKVAIIKQGRLIADGMMSEVVKDRESLESLFMETAADEK